MHFKWNHTPPTAEQESAAGELGEKLGISPILAALLIRRGITTESAHQPFSDEGYGCGCRPAQ